MNKSEIRKLIFKRLSEFENKSVLDRLITDKLFSINPFNRILRVFIYNSLPGEVDTSGIIERLLSAGHNVYLPRINGKIMSLIEVNGNTEYIQNSYGIYEPAGEPYEGDVDICIIPLVAFDRSRVRLGRGGGFYDRFLQDSKALKIALAYSVQEYEIIPIEPHDIIMDMIITDREVII
jgi:5-formyltetrahydrofolate cyclo-ligase